MSLVSRFDLDYTKDLLSSGACLPDEDRRLLSEFLDAGQCPNASHDGMREKAALLLVRAHDDKEKSSLTALEIS